MKLVGLRCLTSTQPRAGALCSTNHHFPEIWRLSPGGERGTETGGPILSCEPATVAELETAWAEATRATGWWAVEGIALLALFGSTIAMGRFARQRSSARRSRATAWGPGFVAKVAFGVSACAAITAAGHLESPPAPEWHVVQPIEGSGSALDDDWCSYVGPGVPPLPYGREYDRAEPTALLSATFTDGSPSLFDVLNVWDHATFPQQVLVALDAETLDILWHYGVCRQTRPRFVPLGTLALVDAWGYAQSIDGDGKVHHAWSVSDNAWFAYQEGQSAVFQRAISDSGVEVEAVVDPFTGSFQERRPRRSRVSRNGAGLLTQLPEGQGGLERTLQCEEYRFTSLPHQTTAVRHGAQIWRKPYSAVWCLHEFFYGYAPYDRALVRIDPSTGEPLAELSERTLARLSAGSEPNPEYEPGDQP